MKNVHYNSKGNLVMDKVQIKQRIDTLKQWPDPTGRVSGGIYELERLLTPFEQAAYDEQYRKRSNITGPALASSFTPDITETTGDKYNLVSAVGIILFIVMLMSVWITTGT